jgi:hypothetical protein
MRGKVIVIPASEAQPVSTFDYDLPPAKGMLEAWLDEGTIEVVENFNKFMHSTTVSYSPCTVFRSKEAQMCDEPANNRANHEWYKNFGLEEIRDQVLKGTVLVITGDKEFLELVNDYLYV